MQSGLGLDGRQGFQRPTWSGVDGEIVLLTSHQALTSRIGDHGAIVRAVLGLRIEESAMHLGHRILKHLPKPCVSTHSASDDEPLQAGEFKRTTAFDSQGRYN